MPELPDIVVYLEALERRTVGHSLERLRLASPAVLRTYDPPFNAVEGKSFGACGESESESSSNSTKTCSWSST